MVLLRSAELDRDEEQAHTATRLGSRVGMGCRGNWVATSGLCKCGASGLPLKLWGFLVREASANQSQQH